MAGSDITATTVEGSIVSGVFDPASTTFIATAARTTTTFTLVNTFFATSNADTARKLSVTTTGASDNEKTVTIVGTDLNDKTITDIITSTGSAATVDGVRFFKTIVSATCSAQYAANVSVGITDLATSSLLTGRTRLKAFTTISNAASTRIEFINGTAPADDGAEAVFITRTSGVANAADDVYIPEEGVLFKNNLMIQFNVSGAKMVTAFHA